MAARRPRVTPAERLERHGAVDDPAVVLEAAARFLEARPRSVTEVRRRLGRAGYRSELVEGAIVRLGELGILDDEAFGRAWVESRDRARPRGEIALRRELALKGVDRSIVNDLLEERREAAGTDDTGDADTGPDVTAAAKLIARNERALGRIADPRKRRQRAYTLLARNGFDPETCRSVAATVTMSAADASETNGEGEGDDVET